MTTGFSHVFEQVVRLSTPGHGEDGTDEAPDVQGHARLRETGHDVADAKDAQNVVEAAVVHREAAGPAGG